MHPVEEDLVDLAKKIMFLFFIYLHPEISEVANGSFNDQGQEIINFAEKNKIVLINELRLGISLRQYWNADLIHYNDSGQAFLSENLYPIFLEHLEAKY